MNAFVTAYDQASLEWDEIQRNARIRASFESLVLVHVGALISTFPTYAKPDLMKLLKLNPTDPAVAYRGLFVQSVTVFEAFIKRLIEAVISKKIAAAGSFENLDRGIAAANFWYTGNYFQQEKDEYIAGRTSFDPLVNRLMTCRKDGGAVQLNAEAFTYILGNCTPKKLQRRLGELKVAEPFGDDLGKTAALKKWRGGGVKAIVKAAEETLEEVIKKRNTFTHTAGNSATVTLSDVEDVCGFLAALAGGFTEMYGKA